MIKPPVVTKDTRIWDLVYYWEGSYERQYIAVTDKKGKIIFIEWPLTNAY